MICSGVYLFLTIYFPPFYDIISGIVFGGQVKNRIYLSYKWPIYDDKGRIAGISCFATDITEREQAQEAKQQAIVKTSFDGFWITDIEGRLTEINDSYCKMTGYTREELLNMSIPDIEASESPEDVARHIKKIREQGSDHFETRHRCKDGKLIDVELNTSYLDREKGQIFVFIRDITGQKQAEASQEIPLRNKSGRPATELQKRFVREGLRDLSEGAGIRLIFNLCRYRPECDKKIGNCIKHFKSARVLLAASDQELQQIGVCSRGLFTIKLLRELPAEVLKQNIIERSIYKSSKEIIDYLYYSMRDLKNEVFKVIYLNNRSQIIDTVDLFAGTTDSIPIRPREIIESAIAHSATGLIFVHNHPTGDPTPSKTDKQLTRDLVFVGDILQIKVLDHIIIGENSYFSFADDGLIQKYNDNFLNLKIRGVLASIPLYQHYNNLPRGLHLQHQVNTLSNIGSYLMRKKKPLHLKPSAKAAKPTMTG